MAVTAIVNSVIATDSESGMVMVNANVTFMDGVTNLGTETFGDGITQKTAIARTWLINSIAGKINIRKAVLTSQQGYLAQCDIIKTGIQGLI